MATLRRPKTVLLLACTALVLAGCGLQFAYRTCPTSLTWRLQLVSCLEPWAQTIRYARYVLHACINACLNAFMRICHVPIRDWLVAMLRVQAISRKAVDAWANELHFDLTVDNFPGGGVGMHEDCLKLSNNIQAQFKKRRMKPYKTEAELEALKKDPTPRPSNENKAAPKKPQAAQRQSKRSRKPVIIDDDSSDSGVLEVDKKAETRGAGSRPTRAKAATWTDPAPTASLPTPAPSTALKPAAKVPAKPTSNVGDNADSNSFSPSSTIGAAAITSASHNFATSATPPAQQVFQQPTDTAMHEKTLHRQQAPCLSSALPDMAMHKYTAMSTPANTQPMHAQMEATPASPPQGQMQMQPNMSPAFTGHTPPHTSWPPNCGMTQNGYAGYMPTGMPNCFYPNMMPMMPQMMLPHMQMYPQCAFMPMGYAPVQPQPAKETSPSFAAIQARLNFEDKKRSDLLYSQALHEYYVEKNGLLK
uniref:Uncharacterized protein n=1 Tax=Chrysotila carterae TaxID=13221 RepID=A0A7S4C6W6_CHRCT